ncbi:30S ribosomal protein S19 [Candidatus Dojkabacteria bacterium HGW-Dojkabacteria-1]|uniref:Small ribosomal subunit protein uS19 n=1 Tax=Candidatus Dojkabacteria bacterium HGW-Dojkabacteria-1 TaxID=2013761 RepID=A0A2N2F331_9BACT|nr:ribosomal protein S19 [uncultured bacterium]PKN02556.1 MAG: 30S ribosomal protein S19 [Candidatus Dojkabacteria bacterium HGW-Dojkabacteria-1]
MSRSLKKGPYVDKNVQKKVAQALESGNRKPIKTWARASTITPEMVGLTFAVHNGKKHEDVLIEESMIGHRLGEFVQTRKFKGHAKKGKLAKVYGSSGRFEE